MAEKIEQKVAIRKGEKKICIAYYVCSMYIVCMGHSKRTRDEKKKTTTIVASKMSQCKILSTYSLFMAFKQIENKF